MYRIVFRMGFDFDCGLGLMVKTSKDEWANHEVNSPE